MRTMRDLEELGFSTLEAYLRSGQFKPDGNFGADVECDGAGHVRVSLSKGKAALERHYLLLLPVLEAEEPLLLPGTPVPGGVDFDLNALGEALFQGGGEWKCVVAMGNREEFLASRLRENGEPLFLPSAPEQPEEKPRSGGLGRLKKLFAARETPEQSAPTAPALQLWADSLRLQDTGLREASVARRLLLQASRKRRLLSLVCLSEAQARPRLSGEVFHRCQTLEEEPPFRFTVVMAVYNVAPYLEEAVESVLNQDIGFQEHVQLILVDDGSTDGSGQLCRRYAQRYPRNIVALHQENQGAASARNAGLAAASGAYVNFMDPDDKLSPNTLSAVSSFFSAHGDEVDVACIPLYFFEARAGGYWQNYKHEKGARVIDLWSEWSASDMNTAASFIRLEAARRYQFDGSLPTGEDMKLLLCVLLDRMRLGVVPQAAYWYRRRSSGSSLINRSKLQSSWYVAYFTNLSFFALEYSRKKLGFAPEFVQNTLMMDLQWRFKERNEPEGGLTAAQRSAYTQTVAKVLGQLSLNVILAQRKLSAPELFQVLSLKYGQPPRLQPGDSDLHALAEGQRVFSCSELPVSLERITLGEDGLCLEGCIQYPAALKAEDARLYLVAAGDYYRCQRLPRRSVTIRNSFGPLSHNQHFRVTLPLTDSYDGRLLRLVSIVGGQDIVHRSYHYPPCSAFFGQVKGQYLWCPLAVVTAEKTGLRLRLNPAPRADWERSYLSALEERVVTPERQKRSAILPRELTPERLEQVRTLRAFALEQRRERPLWLFSDGAERSGGSAEQVFRALRKRSDCPAELCFVLAADSPDFQRMSEFGTVLALGSQEHLQALLQAEAVCFSQEEEVLLAPFTGDSEGFAQRRYYADLLSGQRYVLLCTEKPEAEGWAVVPGVVENYCCEAVVVRSERDAERVMEVLKQAGKAR